MWVIIWYTKQQPSVWDCKNISTLGKYFNINFTSGHKDSFPEIEDTPLSFIEL